MVNGRKTRPDVKCARTGSTPIERRWNEAPSEHSDATCHTSDARRCGAPSRGLHPTFPVSMRSGDKATSKDRYCGYRRYCSTSSKSETFGTNTSRQRVRHGVVKLIEWAQVHQRSPAAALGQAFRASADRRLGRITKISRSGRCRSGIPGCASRSTLRRPCSCCRHRHRQRSHRHRRSTRHRRRRR